MAEQECPKCPPKGAPAWMVTFADLMTLLLTFFVLLLSMADTTPRKFERAATSLREAFSGIRMIGQPVTKMIEIPFQVPATNKVEIKEDEKSDELTHAHKKDYDYEFESIKSNAIQREKELTQEISAQEAEVLDAIEKELQEQLSKEIDTGVAEVEKKQDKILLRFPAKTTFLSGSAELNPKMEKLFERLALSLKGMNVHSIISGHTDDVPISTRIFRSNWDLSAARASSIAMVFENFGNFSPDQLEVAGFADGRPLVPNDSPENRETNRRIEVFIQPGSKEFDDSIFEEVIQSLDGSTAEEESSLEIIPDTTSVLPPEEDRKPLSVKDTSKKKSRLSEIIERIRQFNAKKK